MSVLPVRKQPIPCPRCGEALFPKDEPGSIDILTGTYDNTVVEALTVEVQRHKCPGLARIPRSPQW